MREKIGAIGEILENLGRTGIKSANRYIYTSINSTFSGKIAIQPVDPAHCIVLVERLGTTDGTIKHYTYTLNESSIYITHSGWTADGTIDLAFTIVEFYAIGGN